MPRPKDGDEWPFSLGCLAPQTPGNGCCAASASVATVTKTANALRALSSLAAPAHLAVYCPAMGELGDGLVVAGSFPPLDDLDTPGIAFIDELQEKYNPDDKVTHVMYVGGLLEAMVQTEALRLAMLEVPFEELKPVDVLEYGFYRIKDLDTGGLSATPLTYGPGDVEGVDMVRVDQAQGGKVVLLGNWPTRGIYKHE